jgi:hypothetical protein
MRLSINEKSKFHMVFSISNCYCHYYKVPFLKLLLSLLYAPFSQTATVIIIRPLFSNRYCHYYKAPFLKLLLSLL